MGKLSGIRVVDLSQFLPGPMMTMMMADQGAEVVLSGAGVGSWHASGSGQARGDGAGGREGEAPRGAWAPSARRMQGPGL